MITDYTSAPNCANDEHAFQLAFSRKQSDIAEMKKIYCGPCPIKIHCLTIALHTDAYGIWGGKTREQRMELGRLAGLFNS